MLRGDRVKKCLCIFSLIVLSIICVKLNFLNNDTSIDGKILFCMINDRPAIYDSSDKTIKQLDASAFQAVFAGDGTILLNKYDRICKYNADTGESTIIYQGESFDFLTVCNDKLLSLSKDNLIYLYDMEKRQKEILLQDSGSCIHAWSDDGKFLYYSDMTNKIKCLDTLANEITEIGTGRSPVVRNSFIAYKDKDRLIVENLKTGKKYSYSGAAYTYCFSPSGKELLIETEMTLNTGIKNLFQNGTVLGHKLIVWNYEENRKSTVVDSGIKSSSLIFDWCR